MTATGRTATEASRLDTASAWRIRIAADASLAKSDAFLAWLADPQNQEAFARAAATWNAFDDHLAAPQLLAMRADALQRARRSSLRHLLPSRRRLMTLAASLVVAFAGSFAVWQTLQAPAAYATGIGERRLVTLDDGSRISMDSNTAVEIRYGNTYRQLVLERGRARFDVARDIARPFSVTAGNQIVVAVGTSFNVERLYDKVLVTLIEGRVVVKAQPAGPATTAAPATATFTLSAGQELVAARGTAPVVAVTSLPVATAWESGRLILDNVPLGEAVQRVNRYTNEPLTVDPAVANVRVSGVFNAGDIGAFVDGITSYFPVQASTSPNSRIVLEKRM